MNDILSCFSGEDAPVPVHVHLNNASMIKMLTLTKPNKILPMQCNAMQCLMLLRSWTTLYTCVWVPLVLTPLPNCEFYFVLFPDPIYPFGYPSNG